MMKMNKWTMALAAAGVVSLSSVAQAQEAAAGANALAASTTLSGYVSTSYTMAKDGVTPEGTFRAGDDIDSYALDVVSLKLASAQGAGEWATGYTVELWAGPAASDIGTNDGTAGTVELMQANINLRLPVGNGIDLTVGQFGTVVGAETYNYNENAFHGHSFGFALEPTHHTGILAGYQIADGLAIQVGAVNDSTTNATNNNSTSSTGMLASISYTLPDSLGPLGGTELYAAMVEGQGADGSETDYNYISAEIPLPVDGLTYKVAWDIVETDSAADSNVVGHYFSYTVNDKLTVNIRHERGNINHDIGGTRWDNADGLESTTVGLDYKLWENVTSRVEFTTSDADNVTTDEETLAFNIIYSF